MAVFNVRWIGLQDAIGDFDKEFRAMIKESGTVVRQTANRIAKKSATALRRGRFRAFVTGRLASSHSVRQIKDTDKLKTTAVDNTADYSLYIHQGTRRLRGRPWLRHTVNAEEPRLVRDLTKVVARKKHLEVESAPSLSFTSRR